jgi:F-type H+-transporting ATPase subunit b
MIPFLFAAAEATDSNPAVQIARQFHWEKRLFFSQVILFLIVAIVLAKFAYKPLLAMLEQRRKQIQEGIENAEKTRIELANAQVKAQELLNQASMQASKIVEEARAAALQVSEIQAQKTITQAQDILAKAHQSAEAELARMKDELRREVGRLVVQTTAKVTGKILTIDDQQRLADETNRQLAA